MATTDLTPSKPLGKVRAYILRIAGLSTTAQKVLRICNEPNTCANDLNRVISLDPVLTGRVLQLINSAYYSLPSKVNSLTRAIILLGLNTVRNLVLSFAVFESFSKHDTFRAFSASDFWAHSLSVAAAAKLLSIQNGVPLQEREDYFVAGTQHFLGRGGQPGNSQNVGPDFSERLREGKVCRGHGGAVMPSGNPPAEI